MGWIQRHRVWPRRSWKKDDETFTRLAEELRQLPESPDAQSLECDLRPLFEKLCVGLGDLIKEVEDTPAWMARQHRPPLPREARAIAAGRLRYDEAVALLADADRVRALSGLEFARNLIPFAAVFRDMPMISQAAQAELDAEWRSIRSANDPSHRLHHSAK